MWIKRRDECAGFTTKLDATGGRFAGRFRYAKGGPTLCMCLRSHTTADPWQAELGNRSCLLLNEAIKRLEIQQVNDF